MLIRHSSISESYPKLDEPQSAGEETLLTIDITFVICATLYVSFSSKSKATNVFPKHILKSKARDKLIQARKNFSTFCVSFSSSSEAREGVKSNAYLTSLYCGSTVRSSHQRFSLKKLFLKSLQYPQESPLLKSLFKNVACLKTCNFVKKRPRYSWLLRNF